MFRKMFGWNTYFENESKLEILNILSQYKEKLVILRSNDEVNRIIDFYTRKRREE